MTGVCVGVNVCSDHLLTILVHGMRLRLLLANISKGAHNRYAVGQFLVVLVVVLFEQGLADPLPGILTDRARHLVLIQDHVWEGKTHKGARKCRLPHYSLNRFKLTKATPGSVCPYVAASDAKLIIPTKNDPLLLI